MAATGDPLVYAAQLIELARGEENEEGNPLTAVRHYTTAMEIIASEASKRAAALPRNEARRFFLFQVRSKLEMYYERAELLLGVANGSGLLDKPSGIGNGGSLEAAYSNNYPPALFASTVASEKNSGNRGSITCGGTPEAGASGTSVLGIPLQPEQPAVPIPNPPQSRGGYGGDADAPPMSCYLKPDDAAAATSPPPPVTPELDLDELMRNLGAPPGS